MRQALASASDAIRVWVGVLLFSMCMLGASSAGAEDDFLDVEKAFRPQLLVQPGKAPRMRFDVADGYYLYRERLTLKVDGKDLAALPLPTGKKKFDEAFNKEVEVYYGSLEFELPVAAAGRSVPVEVGYQGCADKGLCYPPQTFSGTVDGTGPVVGSDSTSGSTSRPSSDTGLLSAVPGDNTSALGSVLRAGSLLPILGAFFVAGFLLALTPCVLPMLPILSSIVVGQTGGTSGPGARWRGLALAGAYSLGMALVYSALGVAAGLAGEGLGAALQKPEVLIGFGLALVLLALSMFGVYELQLPQAWTGRWDQAARRLPGGRFIGVFVMGGVSALIVSPCVAAPLAGALIYISQTRDVVLGGAALFALAAGMSVPLLLLGASAGTLLPRAGAWMDGVKKLFGVLLLAVAIWLVAPATGPVIAVGLWGALLILCAVFLWPHQHPAHHGSMLSAQFARAAALTLGFWGALQLWGAASGGKDPLQPLATARAAQAGGQSQRLAVNGPAFMPVRSVAELDAALAAADRPVLLDFYADWCRSCIEMEHKTYADPQIAQRLSHAILLKADVTANSADDQALLKRFGLFGPPAALFFAPGAGPQPALRMIGFEPPAEFAGTLARAGL